MTGSRQQTQPSLREQHPDSWIAVEVGDFIAGTVTDVQQAWSDVRAGGSFYPLLSIDVEEATGYTDPGNLKVHAFGAVLYNEVMRRKPKVGERVTIAYEGERPAKQTGRNPTKLYSVKVHDREGEGEDVYGAIGREQGENTRGKPQGQAASDVPADDGKDLPF